MLVYRLTREKYKDQLSGIGASKFGGRWNSIGTEIIYTAQNRSLAMAEVAVHFNYADLPKDFFMLVINIEDKTKVKTIDKKDLAKTWNCMSHHKINQIIGDKFVAENEFVIVKIRSVITLGDFNILINRAHKDFKTIKIVEEYKFPFDKRLF